MTCSRCEGLMLVEHILDLAESYGEMWASSWRCVNCGHRDDAVIQQHRLAQAKRIPVKSEVVSAHEAAEVSQEIEFIEELAA